MGATDSFLSLIPETTESKPNKQMYGYAKTYDKFNPEEVSNLVIHHTGGDTPEGAMAWWKNKESKGVGAHYIINKDGSVIETAPMTHSTGHIMPDLATKKINNRTSLGIEIVGKSDKDVTQAQKDAVKRLYEKQILPTYPNIKLENIRGHGELAKGYTGSHARPEDEGSAVVNFLRAKQANPQQTNNFTSLIPTETIAPVAENQGYYNPQTEYKPGFYNPNFVAQGIRAREAGGGNLAPIVANTAEALKTMSYEDWKKNSLTANLLKAGIMPNPYMLSKANREEGRQKLGEIGTGLYEAVTNPGQTLEAISNLKAEQFIPEMIKGGIYDLPLGLATKPLMEGAKVIGKTGMNVARNRIINPIAETYEGRITPRQAITELQQPKATVSIEGANYQPELNTQPVTKTVSRDVSDLNDAEFQKYINRPIGEDYNFGTKQITTNEPKTINTEPKSFIVPEEQPINRFETSPFNPVELTDRESLLKKVGHENIRHSALEGNPKEASSQFATSKADQGPYGSGMTNQINTEKAVQTKHLEDIQKEVGGTTIRYDTQWQQGDKIAVGKDIKEALQNSFDNYEKDTSKLYKDADKLHGKKPVNLDKFNEFLNADENFAYQNEIGLQKGIKTFLKNKKFLNKDGTIKPLTVEQSEQVRKYINSKYHFETKGLGGQLKSAIDEDVFGQIGGETYQNARAHFKKGIETYEDPKAMANLLGDKGVNQKIPDELVYSKLPSLDESQFTHLYNTLKENGQVKATNQIDNFLIDQIKQSGKSALNEPWNSVASAKEASKLSNKLNVAFADRPEILQKIYDNIEAGNILHIPAKYPGAGVQTHLLKNKFGEMALQKIGAVFGAGGGGSIGGPIGSAIGTASGEYLASKGTNALRSSKQTKQLEKEIKSGTPLNQIIKE